MNDMNQNYGDYKPEKGSSILGTIGRALGKLIKKSLENYIVVSYEGSEKFRVSIFVFVILFLILHLPLLIVMGVTLFLGVRYSFAGKHDLSKVNRVMDQAGNRATEWYGSFRYSDKEMADLCRKYDSGDGRN